MHICWYMHTIRVLALILPGNKIKLTCIFQLNAIFFTLVVAGQVVANNPHPCVNKDLLTEILKLKRQDFEWKDILNRLRPRAVPSGYTYHPWKTGIILNNKGKSILL